MGKSNKKLGSLLIIIGIMVIIFPIAGKIISENKQKNMMKKFYLDIENNQISENTNDTLNDVLNWGVSEENQEELINNIENIEEGQIKEGKIKKMPTPIGVISIDKINVKLPIAEGIDMDTLRFTVGHMPGTTPIGEIGNSVLAGHRSHSFGAFFNRLDELEEGDSIIIHNTNDKKTNYKVYEKLYVDPDDTSVLKNSTKNKVLTLVTCHPEINPTKRLIIHAIEN